MQVYLNPTPQGFWDRDTLPGLSTYIDHSLTHLLLITVSDGVQTTATSSWNVDDAGANLKHPSRSFWVIYVGDTLFRLSTWHRYTCIIAGILITVSDWHRPQLHSSDDAGVSEPHPSRFLGQRHSWGLSTYIDHSLTHLLLITVSDWHRPQLHSSDDAGVSEPHPSRFLGQRHSPRAVYLHRSLTHSLTSYNCFRLAQYHSYIPVMMQVIYLRWTPLGEVSGTETLSKGCPPT